MIARLRLSFAGLDCLDRYDVEGAERVKQEDKAQNDSNDIERPAFDEHAPR
jgi:hypothetical protein